MNPIVSFCGLRSNNRAFLIPYGRIYAGRRVDTARQTFRLLQLKHNSSANEINGTLKTHKLALLSGDINPEQLKWLVPMNALAHKIKQALFVFGPRTGVPKAVNANFCRAARQAYVRDCRTHAGLDYQPAGTKMWWLP